MSPFDRYRVSADPLRTERRVELVALCIALLLLLQLAWGALRLVFLSGPAPLYPAADSLLVDALSERAVITVEQSQEIRGRPVFWASRTPVEPIEVKQSKPANAKKPGAKVKKLSGVKLVGVFGAGDSAGIIAIVKGQKQRMMVGDEVGDWKLASVSPSEATFTAKGDEAVVALNRGKVVAVTHKKADNDKNKKESDKKAKAGPSDEELRGAGLRMK